MPRRGSGGPGCRLGYGRRVWGRKGYLALEGKFGCEECGALAEMLGRAGPLRSETSRGTGFLVDVREWVTRDLAGSGKG